MTDTAFMEDPARGCAPGRVHPEIFFATPNSPETVEAGLTAQAHRDKARARRACRNCPFAATCFTWAEQEGERHGIWGGVDMASDRERRKAAAKYGIGPAVAEPVIIESDEVLVERVLAGGPGAFKALSEAQRILVVRAALNAGMRWAQIERKYRVNTARLKMLIGEDDESFDGRVRQLHSEGKSDQVIALTLDCTPSRVFKARKRLSLPALFGPGGHTRRELVTA